MIFIVFTDWFFLRHFLLSWGLGQGRECWLVERTNGVGKMGAGWMNRVRFGEGERSGYFGYWDGSGMEHGVVSSPALADDGLPF